MIGYIYKTTNLKTAKIYIGQHVAEKFEPERYIGSGCLFKKILERDGKENFVCELLKECFSLEELNDSEKQFIAAYNSQIYIKYHNNENPDTFFGYKKNCILYNFSTVDSNRYLNNLQTYIDEITDGEDTSSNHADGLYKHFHTEYIPAPDLVPVGATIGFPRIVNGKSFCKTYA
jgi:hypothetical protein